MRCGARVENGPMTIAITTSAPVPREPRQESPAGEIIPCAPRWDHANRNPMDASARRARRPNNHEQRTAQRPCWRSRIAQRGPAAHSQDARTLRRFRQSRRILLGDATVPSIRVLGRRSTRRFTCRGARRGRRGRSGRPVRVTRTIVQRRAPAADLFDSSRDRIKGPRHARCSDAEALTFYSGLFGGDKRCDGAGGSRSRHTGAWSERSRPTNRTSRRGGPSSTGNRRR